MFNPLIQIRIKRVSVFVVLILTACSSFHGTETAERAVTQFHSSYNQARFDQIYAAADPALKATSNQSDFTQTMEGVQRKIGKVKITKRTGSGVTVSTFGTQVSLTYQTEFEQGSGVEQFVWLVKGDTAQLAGYNINSPLLVTK